MAGPEVVDVAPSYDDLGFNALPKVGRASASAHILVTERTAHLREVQLSLSEAVV